MNEAAALPVVAFCYWFVVGVSVSRRHQARGVSGLPCGRLKGIHGLAGMSLLGIEATEVRASVSRIARVERGITGPGGGRPIVIHREEFVRWRESPRLVEDSTSVYCVLTCVKCCRRMSIIRDNVLRRIFVCVLSWHAAAYHLECCRPARGNAILARQYFREYRVGAGVRRSL